MGLGTKEVVFRFSLGGVVVVATRSTVVLLVMVMGFLGQVISSLSPLPPHV